MIAKKGIAHARETVTYVIGEDTDLLVLLCHYAERQMNDLYLKSSKEGEKCWHINSVAEALGESICCVLQLSMHSVDVTQPHDCMVLVKGLP